MASTPLFPKVTFPAGSMMRNEPSEPDNYAPPKSTEEFLRRLANGERYFVGANLVGAHLPRADLQSLKLDGANLAGAFLPGAILINTSLVGANLANANLAHATMVRTDLNRATLKSANLAGAELALARLTTANLVDAQLTRVTLLNSDFCDANLDGLKIGITLLSDLDLSPFVGAKEPIVHTEESIVDFKTVVRSLRAPRLNQFLMRTGMPAILVDYMIECAHAVSGSVFVDMMQSTFISYGAPDEKFAKTLYEELHKNGVRAFLFAEHAVPGQRLDRLMRQGVNDHDRVVLICSKSSLDRSGVLNEIVETLAREARDGGAEYLIPIRLDNYVFADWTPSRPDIAQAIRGRVVADFRGAKKDPTKFAAEFAKLLGALKKKRPHSTARTPPTVKPGQTAVPRTKTATRSTPKGRLPDPGKVS